jgi:superfamily II DNA or RNA helicase
MLTTRLLSHQSACIDRLIEIYNDEKDHGDCGAVVSLLWGSGKTLTSIEAGLSIRNQSPRHERLPILVLSDVSTVEDWGKNATEHYHKTLPWTFVSGKARVGTSAAAMNWHTLKDQIMVISNVEILAGFYEHTLKRRMQLIQKVLDAPSICSARKTVLREFLAEDVKYLNKPIPDEKLALMETCTPTTDARCALFYTKWPVIIIDEAHKVRNSSSVWFSVLAQLRSSFRISLTATPFNNNIYDVISVLAISNVLPGSRKGSRTFEYPLDEWMNVLKTSPETFCEDFKDARDTYIIQGKNEMAVARSHYRPVDIILRVPFDTETEREQYLLTRSVAKENTLTTSVRLKQSCSGIYTHLTEDGINSELSTVVPTKIRAVLEYVEIAASRNEKVNILCEFRASLLQLRQYITAKFGKRVEIFCVNGDTTAHERHLIRNAYEKHHGAAVLIATSVFNQGVNLHCANHTILFNAQWNPVVSDQGRSRCERPAQTKSVFSVQIIIADTIEDQIWAVSSSKRKANLEVMTGEITPDLLCRVQQESDEGESLEDHLRTIDAEILSSIDKEMQRECTHYIESIESLQMEVPSTVRIDPIDSSRAPTFKRMTRVNVVVDGAVVKRRL